MGESPRQVWFECSTPESGLGRFPWNAALSTTRWWAFFSGLVQRPV